MTWRDEDSEPRLRLRPGQVPEDQHPPTPATHPQTCHVPKSRGPQGDPWPPPKPCASLMARPVLQHSPARCHSPWAATHAGSHSTRQHQPAAPRTISRARPPHFLQPPRRALLAGLQPDSCSSLPPPDPISLLVGGWERGPRRLAPMPAHLATLSASAP